MSWVSFIYSSFQYTSKSSDLGSDHRVGALSLNVESDCISARAGNMDRKHEGLAGLHSIFAFFGHGHNMQLTVVWGIWVQQTRSNSKEVAYRDTLEQVSSVHFLLV